MSKRALARFIEFLEEIAAYDSDWEYSDGRRMRNDAAAFLTHYKLVMLKIEAVNAAPLHFIGAAGYRLVPIDGVIVTTGGQYASPQE